MSTENLPKKPSTTSHLKKLKTGGIQSQAAPVENVIEQVPPWLKQLLTKYGEREGRLVGLGEGYSTGAAAMSEAEEGDEAGLSALLQQMAEEGLAQTPTRSSTSVEWGSYPTKAEPDAPALDDLLAHLGTEPPAYQPSAMPAPDWLTDMQGEDYQAQPDYPQASGAAPDWLNDMIEPEEHAAPSVSTSPGAQDVPDWLTDALEKPARSSTPPASAATPAPSPQTRGQDFDVPDWLNDALTIPGDTPPAPTPPTAGSDVPDWLLEKSAESYQHPALPTSDDDQTFIEVPDWLESIASTSAEPQTPPDRDESELAIEVPDWLTNIAPPAAGQTEMASDWQISDWMASDTAGQVKPDASAEWASPGEAGQALPSLDWLFQGDSSNAEPASAGEPAPADSDWMFNLPNELTPDSLTPSTEMSDWLAELPSTEQESGELPDWLKEAPLPSIEPTSDDWLTNLNLSADEPEMPPRSFPADEDVSAWSDPGEIPASSVSMPDEVKSASRYKRLKTQEESTALPIQPTAEPVLPDWAANLVPPSAETSQETASLPDWAAGLTSSEASTETETAPPPPWAQDLVPPDMAPPATPEPAAPPKLSQEPGLKTEKSPAPKEPTVTGSLDWISAPAEPAETANENLVEPSDWLSAFTSDTNLTPDWLTDSTETTPDSTSPDWLSASDEAEENDLLAQRLDWFTQGSPEKVVSVAEQPEILEWLEETEAPTPLPADQPASLTPVATQPDDLDWLRDLPAPSGFEEASVESGVPAQMEEDVPPWLANLSDGTSVDVPGEETAYPTWLTEPAVDSSTETEPQAEPEANIPSWLMGLSTSEAETSTWLAEPAPEEMPTDLSTPPWLTDLSPSPIAETTDQEDSLTDLSGSGIETLPWLVEPTGETADTPETPTWLADLAPASPVESAIETDTEFPTWLTELDSIATETPAWSPDIEQIPSTEPETPAENLAWLTKAAPTLETADEDTDIPAWLSGLTTAEIEAEAGTETPSWLAATPSNEQETLPWLAEAPETPVTDTFSTEPDEAESLEIPGWLTALSTDASTPQDTEPETETPPWLTELATEPETGPVSADEPLTWLSEATSGPEAETDFDTPSWLAELTPQETPPSAPTELSEAEATVPSWLDELPTPGLSEPMAGSASEESITEAPAWLSDLPQAAAPELSTEAETSSWLSELPAEPDTPAWPTSTQATEEADVPSWLAELSTSPAAETEAESESPSWLSELPPTEEETPPWLAAAAPAGEAVEETPAWLAELEDVPLATAAPKAELEVPDWLASSIEATSTPVEAVAIPEPSAWPELSTPAVAEPPPAEVEIELETPDWLAELSPPPAVESAPLALTPETAETPLWPVEPTETPTSAIPTVEEEELETPTWLWDLPPEKRALLEEADSPEALPGSAPETEAETYLWQSEPALSDRLIPKPEAPTPSLWTESPTTPAEVEADTTEPSAWLADLPETSIPVEPETEAPLWLAELTQDSATEEAPAAESEEELVIPDWLGKFSISAPTQVAQEPETPDALTEMVETSSSEVALPQIEVEPEMPSWLGELPAAPTLAAQVEAGAETPPWLAELTVDSAAEEAPMAETEEGLVIPDWLGKSSSDAQVEAEQKLDTPGWLTELVETSPPEITAPQAEVEPEVPSWLSELPQATELEEQGVPEEAAIPAWMSELGEPAPVEAVTETEPEPDMPGWLTDLRAAQATALETETEIPAWLADEPETSAAEIVPVDELAPNQELPAWLAELSAEPAPAAPVDEPTEELAMPSSLTGSLEVAETEEAGEPAAEMAAGEEPVEGLVMPAWLGASTETVAADAPAEAEAEEELVIPTWLGRSAAPVETEAETPSWLDELPEETAAQEGESSMPAWLSELPETAEEEVEIATGTPSWLVDLAPTEPAEIPTWLTEPELETPPAAPLETIEETAEEAPAWLSEVDTSTAGAEVTEIPVEAVEPATSPQEDAPAIPDWLAGLDVAPELPKGDQPAAEAVTDNFLTFEEEPEAPDWLKGEPESPAPSATPGRPKTGPLQLPGEAKPSSSVERMSEWLRNLQPAETPVESEESKPSETTGMLTGLAPLLPAEKIGPVTPTLDPQATATTAESDAVMEAAQHFYTVATQAPQPAALPELPVKREGLIRRWLRALFHLVFIALIALPLIPGLQKSVNGQSVPWTEPAGELSEVLERQRRELTSAQLGVIDLQQPGSVALVSLDYSAATQGEMEPLAEAVISRLRGQGMRLIFVSLEPEGAALAQRTLDRILAERNETYGAEVINLGYVPGQVVGIRELVSGRRSLAGMADFKNGLTFAAPERAGWNTINNLGQIDVVITLADNPATARWWIEQMAAAVPPDDGERYLLAATSALADPLVRPYLESGQLNGLLSGLNGAAAIEAGRKNFGAARQMLDSQSMAHLTMVILIAAGTMAGWMPEQKDQA